MGEPHVEDVFDAWLRRRAAGDSTAGLVALYEMAAAARGVLIGDLSPVERADLTRRALPAMEPGWEALPNSDRPEDPIELVPYDPSWPAQYESWRRRLVEVLVAPARRIEHIGSTAVPGLSAKPVIDILVSIDDVRAEAAYVPAIESLGVQLRSRDDQHRFFRPFAGRPRDVQVHVCGTGTEWEARHLRFRDHLREHPEARAEYQVAKQEAAARWRHDRIAYSDAKSEVIQRLLSQAGS